jgi:hypothetical protein
VLCNTGITSVTIYKHPTVSRHGAVGISNSGVSDRLGLVGDDNITVVELVLPHEVYSFLSTCLIHLLLAVMQRGGHFNLARQWQHQLLQI